MRYKPLSVYMDFHRHTYLFIGEGRKKRHYIPMSAGGLSVIKLDAKAEHKLGLREIEYPLPRAEKLFREAARDYGATKEATRALRVRPREKARLAALEVRP